jgi:hypothetical protein
MVPNDPPGGMSELFDSTVPEVDALASDVAYGGDSVEGVMGIAITSLEVCER